TLNTLRNSTPEPTITSNIKKGSDHVRSGNMQTRSEQTYIIEGYVNTSKGRVRTRVKNDISFANTQQSGKSEDKTRHHIVNQYAHLKNTSKSIGGGLKNRSLQREFSFSLGVDTKRGSHNSKDHRERSVRIHQNFTRHILQSEDSLPLYQAHI